MSWHAEALKFTFTITKVPRPAPKKQPHSIIPPPPNLPLALNKSATPKHFPIIKAHGIQTQTKCKRIVKKKKCKIKPLSILDTFQLKKIYSFYDLTVKTKVGSKLLYDVRKDNITIKKSLLYK